MSRFYARYDSECEACGGLIVMGEEAGYVAGDVWCDNCLDCLDESCIPGCLDRPEEVSLDDL